MVVTCEINFDQNLYGTYFAGQIVSGSITLSTDKTKIVKGFALKINGQARTRWSEHHGTGSRRRNVHYSGTEDYFASTTYLLGSEDSQTVQIEPGTHTYTFACGLPPQCPSSFEGKDGHIRYVVKAVLIRPWKFDQTYTRGFTVLKLMDLNYESPVIRVPAAQENHRTFYCGPCTSKPLKMSVSLPQTGFVPGQNIFVTVSITNESNVPVTEMKISLIMFAMLFSQIPHVNSRIERTNLGKIKGGEVHSQTTRTITESIRVPPTPPTCLNLCSVLKISYQIDVEAKLKGMHDSVMVSVPIVIGNVPLLSVIQHQPMHRLSQNPPPEASAPQLADSDFKSDSVFTMSNGSMLPVVDPVRNPMDPLSSAEMNISPPSYDEAIFMTHTDCSEDDQHPLGKNDFVPRYPVFNIPEPCAPPEDEPFTNTDPNKSTWL